MTTEKTCGSVLAVDFDGEPDQVCTIPVDARGAHDGPDHRSASASWGDPALPHPQPDAYDGTADAP